MPLADTGKAIHNVTKLIQTNLTNILKHQHGLEIPVKVGRPEPPADTTWNKRINLFLYEALFDPSLKNISFYEGQPAPLWLILRYLMTAFDEKGDSESVDAHHYLGEGIRALQELNYLKITSSLADALQENPEPLKITFNEASVELLSKLMQGTDEKYRFSFAFEVRPVMIATSELPLRSLLVGIDYTKSPTEIIGEQGIKIPVIPSLAAPKIIKIIPESFEGGDRLILIGSQLNLPNTSVHLGKSELTIESQQADKMECKVPDQLNEGKTLSAGTYPLFIKQTLSSGRERSSNIISAGFLPILDKVMVNSLNLLPDPTDPSLTVATAKIKLEGYLLGAGKDDIILLLYKEGKVKYFFEIPGTPLPSPLPPGAVQAELEFEIFATHRIMPGIYRGILLVNGQQARNCPNMKLET